MTQENTTELLADLQNWYLAQCNGDWEHDFGVSIQSLDNPGWSISIDLQDTILEDKPFDKIAIETSEDDWLHCHVTTATYYAACGPLQLPQALSTFINWAKTTPDWLSRRPFPPQLLTDEQTDRSNWDALKKIDQQPERCQIEDCNHNRIQYSVFCRRHHYEQLHKKPPPDGVHQIWLYGFSEKVPEARDRIVARVRDIFGENAVSPGPQSNTTTLSVEWLKAPFQLHLLDYPEEALCKIVPAKQHDPPERTELLMRLFFCDIVEPVKDTTGGVTASLNFWSPETQRSD